MTKKEKQTTITGLLRRSKVPTPSLIPNESFCLKRTDHAGETNEVLLSSVHRPTPTGHPAGDFRRQSSSAFRPPTL